VVDEQREALDVCDVVLLLGLRAAAHRPSGGAGSRCDLEMHLEMHLEPAPNFFNYFLATQVNSTNISTHIFDRISRPTTP
jgi:hypothetical protein